MDTPETYFGAQPYGQEASAFAKRELEGEEFGLELDVQEIDPFGRLLAYVYLPDGQMFNEKLVEEGYAQVATFPPNVKYQDRFLEVQRGEGGEPWPLHRRSLPADGSGQRHRRGMFGA